MNWNDSISQLLSRILFLLVLTSGIVMAEPQPPEMTPAVMSTSSTVLLALNENGPAVYTSQYQYAGIYDPTQIFRRYPGAIEWRAGGEPAILKNVACESARSRLTRYGIWSGALKADGSCLNSEPQDFAVGNYLNYLSTHPAKN
jgi:hypothetical protein